MKLLFINASMFSTNTDKYFVSWNMEPIVFGLIKKLTPSDISIDFVDERYEKVKYSADYDAVVFSVRTYNARNSYKISKRFRKLGVKTLAGGYHCALMPEETVKHFDSVALGSVEDCWPLMLRDLKENRLQSLYSRTKKTGKMIRPDRKLFMKYPSLPMKVIETSRGCPHHCNYCCTSRLHNGRVLYKDLAVLEKEFMELRNHLVLFSDENIASDKKRLRKICKMTKKHNIKWLSQADIHIADNEDFVHMLADSGCKGLLIGFESIDKATLKEYNKYINLNADYKRTVDILHKYGIMIYAAFILDTHEHDILDATKDFIIKNKLDLCGLHPLTPFPGTNLYEEKLSTSPNVKEWWLRKFYPYFKFVFKDEHSEKMEKYINRTREKIFSLPGIFKRVDFKYFFNNPAMVFLSFIFNLAAITEVKGKSNINE
ncbi:MAG: radical SAM protein [candidate division WOR-3 bacterium]|nr:radical SAM protein [candidate division WOR-3 bacterium]